jgi:DNA-binding transcriptional LysR family regulator
MEIRQFRYFAAAAEALNFTRAAEKLRVAQPALSRQIRGLEEELGVQLLERDSRRVSLTDEGHVFLEDVREIIDLVDAAEARVKRSRSAPSTLFNLGYAPSLTAPWLSEILASLRRHAPKTRIRLSDLTNEEMIEMIRGQTLNAGILPDQAVPRGGVFVTQPLHPIGFEVALPHGHTLAEKKKLHVRDLAQECLVIYDRHAFPDYFNSLHRMFATVGEPLIPGLEVNSGASLLTSVKESQGVAIVATMVRLSEPEGLEFRPIDPEPEGFLLCLVTHRDAPLRRINPMRKAIQAVFELGRESSPAKKGEPD